jgi:hypothetical protein
MVHLRRKCWSVVNFIVACPQKWYHIPQVKSANLSLQRQVRARFEHNTKITNSFNGKKNIAKFTRSTIWGVQLKSGDN